MNCFKAFAHKTPNGWQVFMRLARDANAKPLLGKNKQVCIFKSELDAQREVNRHLLAYLNGDYQRYGKRANNDVRKAAEKLFSKPSHHHD